ncbi:hypothetical protein SUGI_0422710 [Cryptomeria japonica]|nr:hypothetical protein SUGI_0422710 [Cryptomeria japonica]
MMRECCVTAQAQAHSTGFLTKNELAGGKCESTVLDLTVFWNVDACSNLNSVTFSMAEEVQSISGRLWN